MPPTKKQRDYMRFTNEFVAQYGRELVDIVHRYGKKAYVFYDDSWIGVEPYSDLFTSFGFDGLIKCVFSGYEARLCAGAKADVHELRLHPYLFPVGLGGAPTFAPGGNPALDAGKYWVSVRRALLRQPVDRLGLGGYLHLTEGYPDFVDTIERIMDEFRQIKALHANGGVYTLPINVAVLHAWGHLRSWTLSGHFHETYMHDLIHINEALSGLPVNVSFISFDDLKHNDLSNYQVIINAGASDTAWSGGDNWRDPAVEEILTKWVYEGGTFIGVNEPSAVEGFDTAFKMASVLGVDKDTAARVCHGKWSYDLSEVENLIPNGSTIPERCLVHLTDGKAKVLKDNNGNPLFTVNTFGKGKGIYLSSFENTTVNNRLLLNILLFAVNQPMEQNYITDNPATECAYFPEGNKLIVINNSDKTQSTSVTTDNGIKTFENVEPFDTVIIDL